MTRTHSPSEDDRRVRHLVADPLDPVEQALDEPRLRRLAGGAGTRGRGWRGVPEPPPPPSALLARRGGEPRRGWAGWHAYDTPDARRQLDLAREALIPGADPLAAALVRQLAARVLADEGDVAVGRRILAGDTELPAGPPFLTVMLELLQGELALAAGDAAAAAAHIEALADHGWNAQRRLLAAGLAMARGPPPGRPRPPGAGTAPGGVVRAPGRGVRGRGRRGRAGARPPRPRTISTSSSSGAGCAIC